MTGNVARVAVRRFLQ